MSGCKVCGLPTTSASGICDDCLEAIRRDLTHAAHLPAPEPVEAREAFETWAITEGIEIAKWDGKHPGWSGYQSREASKTWRCWQAAQSALARENEGLRVRLRHYAVKEEFDYPAERPVSCGMFCQECKENVSNDGLTGHAAGCLTTPAGGA